MFQLHATIGKMSGELLRDLADAKIIPFNMSDYGLFLDHYTYALEKNASKELIEYSINMSEHDPFYLFTHYFIGLDLC